MFIVPRKVLFKLAEKPANLAEAEGFSYSIFKKQLKSIQPFAGNYDVKPYLQMCGVLKPHCPPIELVGEGSSRTAFCMDGCKCLKIAKTPAGTAQNKVEWQNLRKFAGYHCFPDIEDHDDKFLSVFTECCARAEDDDFERLYGCRLWLICALLARLLKWKMDCSQWKEAVKMIDKTSPKFKSGSETALAAAEYSDKLKDLAQSLGTAKDPQWNILRDLVKFYKKNGWSDSGLIVGDLDRADNWGLHLDDAVGHLMPVIIDAGFSKDVFDEFYS